MCYFPEMIIDERCSYSIFNIVGAESEGFQKAAPPGVGVYHKDFSMKPKFIFSSASELIFPDFIRG